MKKLLSFALAAMVCAGAWAKPIFVGHRGSDIGLENSVESFTNGAKRGYQLLETDWKLTADKQFVCSHDDDTKRLGGTLTLASSTLAELQSEELKQTRSGVVYTGRLCSAKEYLDVCREYNVRPLIELKWTTGINSNDQSNIPLLISFIEEQGFRKNCIILTSMKPCLEYIRKNYPDIELQFLTGQYWANHFDWCVEYGMDVDIQTGYFDKATIDKFHDAGLKVNIWTANSDTDYKKYGDWGVDFVTTDKLDPASVPELDPLSSIRPNKTDFPEIAAQPRGRFLPALETSVAWPAGLAAGNVRRMVYAQGKWAVLTTSDEGSQVSLVDPLTGKVTATVTAPETLSDLTAGCDGRLYGVSAKDTRVFMWEPDLSQFCLLLTAGMVPAYDGCHRLAMSGTPTNGYLYVTAAESATAPLQVAVFDFKASNKTHFATVPFASGVTAEALGDYRIAVTPTARENFIVESPLTATVEYRLEREGTPRLNVHATAPEAPVANGGRSFGRRGLKAYSMVPGEAGAFTLADIAAGIASPAEVADPLKPFGEAVPAITATAIDAAANRLLAIAPGAGAVTYTLDTSAKPAEPEQADITIERIWLNSLSTGNAPANIDGTNAQQGTAVNGLFYVNNCADKLIYVFDRTGCIGSMPGGAGWGTCRDDAGNIIVRDDKQTGTSHNFIIYPAGSTPESHGEPVRVTAEVKLNGQTNFINASGNVLGELGYIYLYPNKQTAINIVRMAGGEVRGATASGDLTMTGSTAGYVVPIDNNSENWLYHVRNYGISEYSGGESTEWMGRGNTTVPNRNTTGGCARFLIRGNVMLAHNSGANYVGGFTLRNMSNNREVLKSFDPIGDMGYKTGGNYSTFNWLIAEPIDEHACWLYQYCPANGMGLYLVSDGTTSVSDISAAGAQACSLAYDGNTVRVLGAAEGSEVTVYSMSGVAVARGTASGTDVSALPAGIYAVRCGAAGLKFAK